MNIFCNNLIHLFIKLVIILLKIQKKWETDAFAIAKNKIVQMITQ